MILRRKNNAPINRVPQFLADRVGSTTENAWLSSARTEQPGAPVVTRPQQCRLNERQPEKRIESREGDHRAPTGGHATPTGQRLPLAAGLSVPGSFAYSTAANTVAPTAAHPYPRCPLRGPGVGSRSFHRAPGRLPPNPPTGWPICSGNNPARSPPRGTRRQPGQLQSDGELSGAHLGAHLLLRQFCGAQSRLVGFLIGQRPVIRPEEQ